MRKMNVAMTAVMACGMAGVSGVGEAQTPSHFENQHLLASDGLGGDFPDIGDQFGHAVAISGTPGSEVAIVGARTDDTAGGVRAGSAYFYRFNGTNWIEETHVFASDGTIRDEFGYAVDISATPGNEVAIVGAWTDDTPAGTDAGSAYIYRFNGTFWAEETHLFASDGAANDFFGGAVSIHGNVAIVGAQLDDTAGGINAGSVYVYRYNGSSWIEEAHLFASDGQGSPAGGDQFSNSISISGPAGNEVAIVGSFLDNTNAGIDAGSAYIYRFNGASWAEEAHLFAFDAWESSRFGDAVSIHNDVALIGASWDDAGVLINAGAAYVFRFDGLTWNFEAPLNASDAERDDWFGRSVSIGGSPGSEIALIGAMRDDTAGITDSGSAYVYHFNGSTWVEEQHLIASNGAPINNFGTSVSVSGAVAIIGGPGDDTIGGTDAGSAYLYTCIGDCSDSAVISPGQQIILNPLGGSGIPTEDALINITNNSGAPGSAITANETNTNQFPAAGGFSAFDTQLIVNTTMNDGEFFMQISIPFAQADLDAASIADPLTIDLTYYNPISGNWELAVAANTVNSPGFPGPVGDRFAITDTILPTLSPDLGDHGAYWNPTTLQGFAWANVDHTTVYAVGSPPNALPCPADITPSGGNGVVNIDDLVAILNAFGPCPAPPATCNADITPLGGNGMVNIDDLVAILNAFGPCP